MSFGYRTHGSTLNELECLDNQHPIDMGYLGFPIKAFWLLRLDQYTLSLGHDSEVELDWNMVLYLISIIVLNDQHLIHMGYLTISHRTPSLCVRGMSSQ